MSDRMKILISLDRKLVEDMDALAQREGIVRSTLVADALCRYVSAQHTIDTGEMMRRGYEEMAGINREWAESGLQSEVRILDAYEAMLSECEP
ncbi:MAG: hypothetical protein RR482_09470 [Clostridia bacterium]